MNRITPFTLQQNIATDNAFSTIQVIHQIKAKMDGVIDVVNNIETDAHDYTDAKILELSNRIDGEITSLENIVRNNNQIVAELNARVVVLESDLAELNNLLFTKYAELDSKITDEKNARIQADLNTLSEAINYTDSEINKLKAWVEEVVNSRTAYAYSQWDGSWKPINEVFNDIQKKECCMASRELSINLFRKLLDIVLVYDTGQSVKALNCTIDELTTALTSENTLYTFLQKTAGGSGTVMGRVEFTINDFRVNNFTYGYYLGYKLPFNRDPDGTHVSWFTYLANLKSSTGFDSSTFTSEFNYTATI